VYMKAYLIGELADATQPGMLADWHALRRDFEVHASADMRLPGHVLEDPSHALNIKEANECTLNRLRQPLRPRLASPPPTL
jgi:hypothetical protein